MNRREFLATTAVGSLAIPFGLQAAVEKPKLKKAIKFSMIDPKVGTVLQRFELAKKCGFVGLEMDSPTNIDRVQANEAQEKTGVKIHGVVDSAHWGKPLSSPDEKVRAEGLEALKTALEDAKFWGADTVLLVPGVARGGVTYEQCFARSQAEVKKVIPLAEKLGVKIAIETVWNDFITKPEQMIEFVDELKSPVVGAYFDISNMLKYGVPAAEWIRKLGKRMLKFDFKGYSIEKATKEKDPWKGFAVEIGDGSENWPEVLTACGEVGYKTWATAEVGGGGEERLTKISKLMDKILELN
jgi:L-ribulose-5-phosphate 3-epimerase